MLYQDVNQRVQAAEQMLQPDDAYQIVIRSDGSGVINIVDAVDAADDDLKAVMVEFVNLEDLQEHDLACL